MEAVDSHLTTKHNKVNSPQGRQYCRITSLFYSSIQSQIKNIHSVPVYKLKSNQIWPRNRVTVGNYERVN